MISRIGFGCAGIAGHDYGPVDAGVARSALHAAFDAGVTFVDVANVYGLGRAEEIVGDATAGIGGVTVATKVGLCWNEDRRTWRDIRPETIERSIEGSLRRLRRDVLDVVQIHWPDGATAVGDAVGALDRCRQQGKIRHIGICNFSQAQVEAAFRVTDVASLQVPASMLQRDAISLLGRARVDYGMTPLCYNVLGQGLLTGKYSMKTWFSEADVRHRSALFDEPMRSTALAQVEAMRGIASARGSTIGQVATRWLLDAVPGGGAIIGAKSPEQARENATLLSPLSVGERELIESAAVPT